MGSPAFASTTSRMVLLLVVAAAAASTAAAQSYAKTSEDKPSRETCGCARTGTPGKCIQLLSYNYGSSGPGVCKARGNTCEAPWECVDDALATHKCMEQGAGTSYECTGSVGYTGRCECAPKKPDIGAVNLVPVQEMPKPDPRGGGGTKPWTPSGPAPPPKDPACRAKHAIVWVGDSPWKCVKSTDVKERSATEAYAAKGWKASPNYININFLRDVDARMYMCLTYGGEESNQVTAERTATSTLQSEETNAFFCKASEPATGVQRKSTDQSYYSPGDTREARSLTTLMKWRDQRPTGYCVGVAKGLKMEFSKLAYVAGLSLSKGGSASKTYPSGGTGSQIFWELKKQSATAQLAYTNSGLVLSEYEQKQQWRRYGSPPPAIIPTVSVRSACSCKHWNKNKEEVEDDDVSDDDDDSGSESE